MREQARAVLEAHWRDGFTVPNGDVYPWQWLWDSCFHAVCWAELGEPDRAISELWSVFASQGTDGFVPHLDYRRGPYPHDEFWKRIATSTITQPPMYGHAIAELERRGIPVPGGIVDRARRGLLHLVRDRPRTPAGLVPVLHPWETGCDDSPRWDAWCPDGWDPDRWREEKGEMVGSLVMGPGGSPVSNPRFTVGSVMFNALVAFNLAELATVIGNDALREEATALARSVDRRWDPGATTWVDDSERPGSAAVPTAEALLPVLVSENAVAVEASFAALTDALAFGTRFGPAGVHVADPAFSATTYWRGPAWPQITYLLAVAAHRHGRPEATRLATALVEGAVTSGFAEYWNPDTGEGLGARPQSWTALAAVAEGWLRSG